MYVISSDAEIKYIRTNKLQKCIYIKNRIKKNKVI